MNLTPGFTMYFETMKMEARDSDQDHMCRDIGTLRNWMDENNGAEKIDGQRVEDGRRHFLDYPNNAKALKD